MNTPNPQPKAEPQRLDKWLWYARFFKSRSLATSACRNRKVRVNGRLVDKPSYGVKADDILTFPQGREIRTVRVLNPGSRRGPATEAQTLYEDLTPKRAVGRPPAVAKPQQRDQGTGRPTKAQRRATDALKGGL